MSEKKIQRYNFKRPDRISKNQIRSLHFVHDRFARNFSSSVSAFLRTVIEVSLDNISQVTYAEFMAGLSDPTCYAAMSLKPLDGNAAVEISPGLVYPMIDRLMGGAGRPISGNRPMTEIEQSIIQNVLKLMIDNLKESWRPVYAIEFALSTVETHPHMVQVVAPNEMIIQFQFSVRMRENSARINIAVPTLVLEPIIHIFDQELYSRKKIIQEGTLLHQLRYIPVNVRIETVETSFPMASLLTLQVGDTLVLDQRKEWPVLLKVAGKSKLHAMAQLGSARTAFGVTGFVRPRKEEAINGYTAQ